MNAKQIMALYNKHERMHIDIPGWTTCSEPTHITSVSPDLDGSFVSYFNFSADQTEKVIAQQIEFFAQCGKNFEWKVYDTDQPRNIAQQLLNNGFSIEDEESFMVLDLQLISTLPEKQAQCVEVTDPIGIRDAIAVKQAQRRDECDGYYRHLVNLKQSRPESIRIYVIYQNGEPVSSAWITFNSINSPFAGIWGGSTTEAYRGRGFYQALLKQRIRDAMLAGKRFLMIDASPMSKPIVEKYGFELVTQTTPYMFIYNNYY